MPTLAERICDFLFKRYDIGRDGSTYMSRWDIFRNRFGWGPKLYLHKFYRSDHDEALHDHPWNFWSLILYNGYIEVTTGPLGNERRVWYGPLSLLRRPAEWRHRVEIPEGRVCWSLVWCGQKVRSWGFFTKCGFIPWREYEKKQEAGLPLCDD